MADMLKTFAGDLKAEREDRNLSLKNISQQTRLNVSILESIESGDFTFQPQPYIRAFLKQYINSIGLDLEETLFDYDLARSGKYKSKRINTGSHKNVSDEKQKISESTKNKSIDEKENPVETSDIQKPPTEDENDKIREPIPEKKPESPGVNYEVKKETKPLTPLKEQKNYSYSNSDKEGKKFSFSFLNSSSARNVFRIALVVIILFLLFFSIKALFFDGSKDKPEVIRQNIDDVFKEQEKKILGKRTPEEIQDSIRKAESELALTKDSITLKVKGISSGVFYLVTDSSNYNKPDKIEFGKNAEGTFKAQRSFFISSDNTESFKVTVNDIPVKFDKPAVSKVKINKNGIVK